MNTGSRHERAGKLLLLGSMIAIGMLVAVSGSTTTGKNVPNTRVAGSITASQYPVDSDISVLDYQAPDFTWLAPVSFNFTIFSNISAVIFVYITSDAVDAYVGSFSVTAGLNEIGVSRGVSFLATPGDHNVTIRFEHGASTVSFTHRLWIGSTLLFASFIFIGAIAVSFAIFAKFGAAPAPNVVVAGSGSAAATPGSAAGDDDTSTTTYVDQSTAPPGRIFCPECKKTIEEGSIFCPECGTRIPRYLRYHP